MISKKSFPYLYWMVASLLLSAVYKSFVASYSQSWMLATMLMPGALFARGIAPLIWQQYAKRIHYWVYLFIGTMWLEYIGAIAAYWLLFELDPDSFPEVLINPAFALLWISALILAELSLSSRLWPSLPPKKSETILTFISNRKEVRITENQCLFIESRDRFTLVHTTDGQSYETQQKISQWDEQLHSWVRVHRSFLVNPAHIRSYNSKEVEIAWEGQTRTVPVSRTYKNRLDEALQPPSRP
jgi:hypothetical protein